MFYSRYSFLLMLLQQLFAAAVYLFSAVSVLSLTAGSAIALAGAAFKFWSQFHDQWEEAFAVSGPFRFIRQPNALGDFFIVFGLALTCENAILAFSFLVLSSFVLYFKMRDIDAHRLARFGIAYRKYRQEVPRFLPNFIPSPVPVPIGRASATFSTVVSYKNQRGVLQLVTILGFVALFAAKWYLFSNAPTLQYLALAVYALVLFSWYLRLQTRRRLVRNAPSAAY